MCSLLHLYQAHQRGGKLQAERCRQLRAGYVLHHTGLQHGVAFRMDGRVGPCVNDFKPVVTC